MLNKLSIIAIKIIWIEILDMVTHNFFTVYRFARKMCICWCLSQHDRYFIRVNRVARE